MVSQKIRRKYCDQAEAIIATLKRGETVKWINRAATVTSLENHYRSCQRGCGRVIEGEWPPR